MTKKPYILIRDARDGEVLIVECDDKPDQTVYYGIIVKIYKNLDEREWEIGDTFTFFETEVIARSVKAEYLHEQAVMEIL